MASLGNVVVTNGSYTKDGKEKKRYVTIGGLYQRDDNSYFVRLSRHINLGAFQHEEGSDVIFASVYDIDNDKRDDDIAF